VRVKSAFREIAGGDYAVTVHHGPLPSGGGDLSPPLRRVGAAEWPRAPLGPDVRRLPERPDTTTHPEELLTEIYLPLE